MVATVKDKTPSKNAIKPPKREDSKYLQFRLVGGVRPLLQQYRRLTSMENRRLAHRMVKVEDGPIRCTLSKVRAKSWRLLLVSDIAHYRISIWHSRPRIYGQGNVADCKLCILYIE